jgi:hypothetical protein
MKRAALQRHPHPTKYSSAHRGTIKCATLPRMLLFIALAASLFQAPRVHAHTQPLSTIDLRLGDAGIDAPVEAPAVDFAHDLPDVTPEILLSAIGSQKHARALSKILATRLAIHAGDKLLTPELRAIEPAVDNEAIRLRLR